jgi:FkbH-like protein
MTDITFAEILKKNKDLGRKLSGGEYHISVLSNIITAQINSILEYSLRNSNINAYVTSGNYDNIVVDSQSNKDRNAVIIFWELANIVEGLQYKANIMSAQQTSELIERVKKEINYVFRNLEKNSLLIINKFSALVFNHHFIRTNNFDKICQSLNKYLEESVGPNVVLIDIEKIFAKRGIEGCVDLRYYYTSKALYSIGFYKDYVEHILPIFLSLKGQGKKAIIFDCDNTLWKGIIGEDGSGDIEMSGSSGSATVFEEVQFIALDMNRRGILVGLCSKNNSEDVDDLINHHPSMHLKNEHIAIKKINWEHKSSSLEKISNELNIGLESIVYVDDSAFEINLIRKLLPQVKTIQVPERPHEYPFLIRKASDLFFKLSSSKEDLRKTEMYKEESLRKNERKIFQTIEDYLSSLNLSLKIHVNNKSIVPRLAQLTQKTNQFNLTTRRYSEADIQHFIEQKKFQVYAFDLNDKFGSSGITGLSILELNFAKKTAIVDSFLMSCRVIGRNIETAFLSFILKDLLEIGFLNTEAQYIKSLKNAQTACFYDKQGFELKDDQIDQKIYSLKLQEHELRMIDYIVVKKIITKV